MNLSVLLAPLFVCPAVNPPFTFQSSFLPIFTQTDQFGEPAALNLSCAMTPTLLHSMPGDTAYE
jgi:hypothetical protein